MVHSPNQPDKKGSRGVLMCEPVNVELDEGLAIMMGSNHGAPTMMGNQSMMEGHHASSQYHDNSSAESMKKKRNRNDKGRGSYRCGKVRPFVDRIPCKIEYVYYLIALILKFCFLFFPST
jgi:hypothetical protein